VELRACQATIGTSRSKLLKARFPSGLPDSRGGEI
jgi:hypothetical protein